MSEVNLDRPGGQRSCDQQSCQNPLAPFHMSVGLVSDIQKPQNQILALVISVTRTSPTIMIQRPAEDGGPYESPNPEHNASDLVPVTRLTGGHDFCGQDCLHNLIDEIWKLADQRRKRLWKTGVKDWK